MSADRSSLIASLQNIATRLRIESVRATSEAGSGHPSSCCSAADLVAALFFGEMRFDPSDPQRDDNDRFVLSKGHAAPLLYAVWAEAGLVPRADLLNLRTLNSDLEGHPTPDCRSSTWLPVRLVRGSVQRSVGIERTPPGLGRPDLRAHR